VSLILATIFSAAVLAQTPPPQPAAAAAAETKTQGRHVDKHKKDNSKKGGPGKDNPDPALLGFLGDYEDAADGLDPIGLSEQVDTDKPKDGSEP
jgi:hypothetical protein